MSLTPMWTLKTVSQYSFMQSSQKRKRHYLKGTGNKARQEEQEFAEDNGTLFVKTQMDGWAANVPWRESRLELRWSFLWWQDCRSSSLPELSTNSTLRTKTAFFYFVCFLNLFSSSSCSQSYYLCKSGKVKTRAGATVYCSWRPESVLSIYIWWLTSTCNFDSRGSKILF